MRDIQTDIGDSRCQKGKICQTCHTCGTDAFSFTRRSGLRNRKWIPKLTSAPAGTFHYRPAHPDALAFRRPNCRPGQCCHGALAMGSKCGNKNNINNIAMSVSANEIFRIFSATLWATFFGERHRIGMRCCHLSVASAGLMTVFLRRLQKFFRLAPGCHREMWIRVACCPPIGIFSAPDSQRQRGLLSLTVTGDLRPLAFSAFGVVYTLDCML